MTQPQPYDAREQAPNGPQEDLDVAYSIISSSEYNELLEQINFGTGYYEDSELKMQMRNVRKGLVADIAFSRTLREHAEQETKVKLADEGFSYYNEDMNEPKIWKAMDELDEDDGPDSYHGDEAAGRTTALLRRGQEIWSDLARPGYSLSIEQAAALDSKASMATFKPIFNHLAAIYHEQTKSKGARTQDNYFGRVNRQELHGSGEGAASELLGNDGGAN